MELGHLGYLRCKEVFGEGGQRGKKRNQAACRWRQKRWGNKKERVVSSFWFRSGRGCGPGPARLRGALPLGARASCASCAPSCPCGGGAGNGGLAGLKRRRRGNVL